MELEGIMLSEINQRKTNTEWFYLYVESKKTKQTKTNITRQKQSPRYREQTDGCQKGGWWENA